MGQPLDEGHHPVVLRGRRHRDAGAAFGEEPFHPVEPSIPPRRAQDDVLAGEGGAIRAEEGVAADDLRRGRFSISRTGSSFSDVRSIRSAVGGTDAAPRADDVERRRDGDGHDDDPAGRGELRDGHPLASPHHVDRVPLPGEERGEPFADSPRPADDADLKFFIGTRECSPRAARSEDGSAKDDRDHRPRRPG